MGAAGERDLPEDERALARALADCGRRLHAAGLVVATDGNLSVRTGEDRWLITRSGTAKDALEPEDVIAVDAAGRVLAGRGKPSTELPLHLACYAARPDVRAVVHAHPPTAVALTLAGISMETPLIPEVVLVLGAIPTLPYVLPGSEALARDAGRAAGRADAFLMERHGAVTLGDTLETACRHMEKLEHAAEILHRAHALAAPRPLTAEEVRAIEALRPDFGLRGPGRPGG